MVRPSVRRWLERRRQMLCGAEEDHEPQKTAEAAAGFHILAEEERFFEITMYKNSIFSFSVLSTTFPYLRTTRSSDSNSTVNTLFHQSPMF